MLRKVDRWLARNAGHRVLLLSKLGVRPARGGRNVTLTVEKLESRTMLAGDLCSLAAGCGSSEPPAEGSPAGEPRVALVLELTTPDGSPLTSLSAGQDFVLHVLSEDMRAAPRGVFAAYLDIEWDATKAEISGPLSYGAEYFNGSRDHVSTATPGVLDEGGAFAGLEEIGAGRHEVFSVPLRALSAGDLVFTSDPAEDLIDQVLAYDEPGGRPLVAPHEVQFGQVAITIAPPADQAPPSGNSAEPVFQTAELPVDDALSSEILESNLENAQGSGAALAAALSPEGAAVSNAPAGAAMAAAAAELHVAYSDASNLLVGALLKLSSAAEQHLGKPGSTSGENAEGEVDPSLHAGNLTDIGPV